jgi:hypothetical protein
LRNLRKPRIIPKRKKIMPKTVLEKVINLESVYGLGEAIDRDKGLVFGVKVMQIGEINDHRPFKVDEVTLSQVENLGNQPNKGVKVRLTHPEGDGLGSHLGRASNFYIEGDSVRADLQIAKSAQHSPMGNMYEYFFTLAEEDPEAFGMSISAVLDGSAMESDQSGIAPLRVSKLYSVDVVGEPAATRGGLFHKEEDVSEETKEDLQEQVVEEVVEASQEPQEQPEAVVEEKVEASVERNHEAFVEAFGDRGARWFLEGKELYECYREAYECELAVREDLQKQIVALQTQLDAAKSEFGEEAPVSTSIELSEEEKATLEKSEKANKAKVAGWDPAMFGMSQILSEAGSK